MFPVLCPSPDKQAGMELVSRELRRELLWAYWNPHSNQVELLTPDPFYVCEVSAAVSLLCGDIYYSLYFH